MTNRTKLIVLTALLVLALLLPSVARAERVDTPSDRNRAEVRALLDRSEWLVPTEAQQPREQRDASYPNDPAETDIHWFQVWECWQGWDECGQEPPGR